jgi:N-ethylmaleimide reductase
MPGLFEPYDLNGLTLPNRAVMAPMTRTRATEDGVPTDLMRDYYVQRAGAGLIITECTQISEQAHGIIRAPGIYREDQIAAWRNITSAVHDAGGRIVNQIWHPGRVSHPGIMNGADPVAPSPIPAEGNFFLPSGRVNFTVPRELRTEELPGIVEDFRGAAENAREAGFDGVEIHAANGYLLQQFLEDKSNRRTDAYGGPIENRARLTLEVVDAVIGTWDARRVGVRLSPAGVHYGMADSNRPAVYDYVIRELSRREVGYIHVVGPNKASYDAGPVQIEDVASFTRRRHAGPIIVNGGYDRDSATAVIEKGDADLVAFGVPFLTNPDLVTRLRTGASYNTPDPTTFYGVGPKGFTDYPTLDEIEA